MIIIKQICLFLLKIIVSYCYICTWHDCVIIMLVVNDDFGTAQRAQNIFFYFLAVAPVMCKYVSAVEFTKYVCNNFYRLCREPNHIPLKCSEVEKQKETDMRTFIEKRVTEAMIRKCHRCGKQFVKESGCNKMTCVCGATSCYVCRARDIDYSHFDGKRQQILFVVFCNVCCV